MTKNIIFDSYALIAHFLKEKGHETVSELLSEMSVEERQGFIPAINVGEIYYILHRKFSEKTAEESIQVVNTMNIEIIEPNLDMVLAAAKLKARFKMSYADAFAAALTISKKGTLITGDKEFKHLVGETHFKVEFI